MVKKVFSVLSAFFLRNVTRCYAKNIIVQTFSVLLSHYYRITIALPSHTNARVIQAICLVGVNCYPETFKIFRFTGPLRKGKKQYLCTRIRQRWIHKRDEERWGLIEEALRTHWGAPRTHWGGIGLYWEVQSIAIILPFFWQFARINNSSPLWFRKGKAILPIRS